MKYYKLLDNKEFIGVVNSADFIEENAKTGWLITSNEVQGHFVEYNAKLYRDSWMRPITNSKHAYTSVTLLETTEDEYMALRQAIDTNEEILLENIEEEEEEEPEIIVNDEPDQILEFVRASKLKEMSANCKHTIEKGFDLKLRDAVYHFSLDTQDQLNLLNLEALAQTQDLIPYHADGEECVFYTAEEINAIVAAANAFKIYQTTYYNALKTYINALETIEDISSITYGTPIPEAYKSDVLKALEQEMEN